MNILFNVFLLIVGFIVLWLSSDKAIVYSSKIAQIFGFSNLFIGFVILAVSTGLPELLVAIQSLIIGKPQLSVSTILGSNFSDISLALGIAACIAPISIIVMDYYEQLIMFAISSLVMILVFLNGQVTKFMGIFLLIIYAAGVAWLWSITHNEPHEQEQPLSQDGIQKRNGIIGRFIMYVFLVIMSSKVCVDNAITLSEHLKMPIDILGVSIFAIGTSLPEISLNIQAIRRKNYSLALGNSLGSVFNQGAFILGLLGLFSPTPLQLKYLYPMVPFMVAAYCLLAYHLISRKPIKLFSGVILILVYGVFLGYELYLYS